MKTQTTLTRLAIVVLLAATLGGHHVSVEPDQRPGGAGRSRAILSAGYPGWNGGAIGCSTSAAPCKT